MNDETALNTSAGLLVLLLEREDPDSLPWAIRYWIHVHGERLKDHLRQHGFYDTRERRLEDLRKEVEHASTRTNIYTPVSERAQIEADIRRVEQFESTQKDTDPCPET